MTIFEVSTHAHSTRAFQRPKENQPWTRVILEIIASKWGALRTVIQRILNIVCYAMKQETANTTTGRDAGISGRMREWEVSDRAYKQSCVGH